MHKPNRLLESDVKEELDWDPMLDDSRIVVKADDGRVILSGVHPEAPTDWRRGMTFLTPASVDHAYAATLIRAALDGVSLPSY